jgi:hypothetical protein
MYTYSAVKQQIQLCLCRHFTTQHFVTTFTYFLLLFQTSNCRVLGYALEPKRYMSFTLIYIYIYCVFNSERGIYFVPDILIGIF